MAYFDRLSSNIQIAFVDVAIASRRNRETAGLYDISSKIVRKNRLNVVDIGVSFFLSVLGGGCSLIARGCTCTSCWLDSLERRLFERWELTVCSERRSPALVRNALGCSCKWFALIRVHLASDIAENPHT